MTVAASLRRGDGASSSDDSSLAIECMTAPIRIVEGDGDSVASLLRPEMLAVPLCRVVRVSIAMFKAVDAGRSASTRATEGVISRPTGGT